MVSLVRSTAERIDTERIRQQHPIADVIERYGIQLRRAGAVLVGRCPFHVDGGRPNLVVYVRSARFVCFRCQIRGDAITFVQQIEQLSFRDAACQLDACATKPEARFVRRRPLLRRDSPVRGEHEIRALAVAVELYANRLLGDRPALDYLASRGFERDVLVQHRIGFAAGDELVPYLAWRDVPVSAARRVGLLLADGRERLAGRIVFPEIRQGKPIWLIARLIRSDDDLPRYLGLPGPKPLLGWDDAQRNLDAVCLVEGPMDLLALRQWGIPGLALCGTALAAVTIDLLRRWKRMYSVFDADAAGREATRELCRALGSRVVPVDLPSGIKDPAELAERPEGAAMFNSVLGAARPDLGPSNRQVGALNASRFRRVSFADEPADRAQRLRIAQLLVSHRVDGAAVLCGGAHNLLFGLAVHNALAIGKVAHFAAGNRLNHSVLPLSSGSPPVVLISVLERVRQAAVPESGD